MFLTSEIFIVVAVRCRRTPVKKKVLPPLQIWVQHVLIFQFDAILQKEHQQKKIQIPVGFTFPSNPKFTDSLKERALHHNTHTAYVI